MSRPPKIITKNIKLETILDNNDYKIFLFWRHKNINNLINYNKPAQLLIYMIYVLCLSRQQILDYNFISMRQYYKLTKYLKTTDIYNIKRAVNYNYL
jgi:hypothetical protein